MGNVINTCQTYRCPCTSGLVFDDCCRPILTGHKRAVTAESLARTRYSAHIVCDLQYLSETWHPATRPAVIRLATDTWWYWFEIDCVTDGSPADQFGQVTYSTYLRHKSNHVEQTVEANFERVHGRWMYRNETALIP
ncbi:YchJ family protein [Gordonia sp. OPL2]|uniref:YchJ family protein n=1 Tax=Gordonia sp. OPL2 TaxID=2486274 RepID=UPI002976B5B6|nr:hypothetical protein EEB19_22760 [Gordonia sp. OPL2]